jgi:5-methylcytosine-specific restriction endonuclease McrA
LQKSVDYLETARIKYRKILDQKILANHEIIELKAIAACANNKVRPQARQVKRTLRVNEFCPYCNNKIYEAHADHIYPVAKGGYNTPENMVNVCSDCNSRKSDMTLTQFIKKNQLDRDRIEKRLTDLGKSF